MRSGTLRRILAVVPIPRSARLMVTVVGLLVWLVLTALIVAVLAA